MNSYKSDSDTLILEGIWRTENIPQLLNLKENFKTIKSTGNISANVDFLIKQHNSSIKKNILYVNQTLKEDNNQFLFKIIKMQKDFLKKLYLSDAQKEAFRDYFTISFSMISINSLLLIAMMSSVIGIALVLEGYAQLYYLGVEAFTMHFFTTFLFREMMPIMTAILLSSKSGASMTASIAAKNMNSELKMLKLMNINTTLFLKPRWLAFLFVTPLMNIYALFFAISCGVIAYSTLSNFGVIFSFNHMFSYFNLTNFIISQIKALIFGWWIGLVTCSAGILYDFGSDNLGRSIVKSIVYSISGIVIFDMIVMLICTKMGV